MREKYKSKISVLGEYFSYVETYSDMTFNLYGRKLNLTKVNKIKFVNMIKELKKKLNLYYYFKKTIISLCFRFIMYDKKYKLTFTSKIIQIKDSDKKYKLINNYTQNKAKLWFERFIKENIIVNSTTSKMIESHSIIYKCTYKNMIRKIQKILYQKIESLYKIFYSKWFSYKIFITNNSVKIL